MKKLFISILLFIFIIGNLQVQNIYANYENTLNDKKETSIDTLENVGEIVTKTIDGLGNKINNNEIDTQLLEKREEVIEFISYTKEKIQNENSVGDINKIVLDAKKSLVLKVVSGVTQYENIGDNIDESIKNNSKKFDIALETIQDSLKNDEFYNLQVKTKFSEIEVKNKLKIFDEKLKINFLYNDGSINYFELNIYNDSIFKKEILENIESGIIPENLIGIDVVNPEVFTIESIVGENLDSTWGVKSYNFESYFPLISNSDYKIKIGVIDTGIDYNHIDLKGKVLEGYDFVNNDNDAIDDQGHGTHVAGTIGANLNNKGIIGINPYVELVPLKICNSSGFCPSYAVTKALSYSTENKLDIVNMSLGGKGDINNNSICDGIKSYTDAGGIAVVAAGNSNIDTNLFVPGGCTSAITVAAIDQNNNKAIFSNYGTKVDVAAPGVNIYSTSLNGNYKNLSGTSMSTPHIVGIISILKTLNKDLNSNGVKQLFKNNQIQVNSDKYIGGNIDLSKIITNLTEIKEEILQVVNIKSIDTEIDDSEIVKDLKFKSNQKQLDNLSIDLEDNGYDEIGNIEVANSIVDFGDNSIEINELGDFDVTINKLVENVVGNLEYNISNGDKIYDSNGNLIDGNVEINNEGDEETIGSEVGEDFDFNSLFLTQSGTGIIDDISIISNDYTNEDTEELVENEIFLPGSEEFIQINNFGEEQEDISEEDKIIVFEDGIFLENYVEDIVEVNQMENGSGVFITDTVYCEIYLGAVCEISFRKAYNYDSTITNTSIANFSASKRILYITGKNIGETEVRYFDSWKQEVKTIFIKVKPRPEPITYDIEISSGFSSNINFPEYISNLNISRIGNLQYSDFSINGNYISLETYNDGIGTIIIKDKSGYLRYTVNLVAKPIINTFILNISDKIESRYNNNYSFRESNRNIAYLSSRKNDGFINGVSVGKTQIKIYKDNKYRRLFDITVNPIPSPIEINCEVIKGEKCNFSIRNNGFYYNESIRGVVGIDSSRSSVRVDTNLSGTAKIYVKSEFGNYVTHILNIKSNPIPPVIKTCETIVGGKCETYNYGSDRGYTYKVSKPGIVGLTSNKYSYLGNPTTYENLHIDGISNGEVEIYVYQNTDHIATIKATILPKITLEFSENEILLKETEDKELQVIKGYGNYRDYYIDGESDRPSWDKEILEFSSNNDGKLDLRGLKQGITYPAVVDKYGNTGRIKVTIEDKTLKLNNYETSINPGEEIYVKVLESYGSVNKIRKTNNNVLIYKHYFADGSEGVKIVGKYTGTTVVSLIDSELDETRGQIGNERTILINIGGNLINPDYKEYEFYDNGMDPCVTDLSGDLHDGKCDAIVEDVVEDEVSEEDIDSELNEVFQGIDLEKIEDENYINSLIIGYVENNSNIGIASSEENIEINNILEDYSEYRYNKSWEEFAESFTNLMILNNPGLENYREKIELNILNNVKNSTYNKYSKNHPDINEALLTNINNNLTPKIKSKQILNSKLYLTKRQEEINFLIGLRNGLSYTIDKSIEEYWINNPEELEQRQKEKLEELANDLGVNIAGKTTGSILALIKSEIENDPYLEEIAKKELTTNIDDLIEEYGNLNGLVENLVLKKAKFAINFLGFSKKVKKNIPKFTGIPLFKGHTGRYIPNNLNEKLALEQAMKNAKNGLEIPIYMTDKRWLGSEGWIKMSQNINGIEIHYVFNKKTKEVDDFKFKD